MAEKIVGQVSAGSHPVYEVVESADGENVIIRHVDDPTRQVVIMRSAVPTLVGILQRVRP